MNKELENEAEDSSGFSPVSASRIEEVNLRRIKVIALGTLAFEIINLLNPNFWAAPILWIGAAYLSAVSAAFLLILILRKPNALLEKPELLNTLFWVLFSVGFFPFLVRDAGAGDSPLNCVLLCTVLICAPLLRVPSLRYIFSASIAVNLLAALYVGSSVPYQYYLEILAINTVAFFAARNLHGRYFALLDEQQRLYDRQLEDKLAQKALQSKVEQDRLVNAARSEFLSRMSHDLRTPLNAVIGLSDIATDERLSREELQTYLTDINRSAKHLLSLINDVLTISKLENGKLTLRPKPCGTDRFFDTVRSVIGVQCAQKQIRFRIERDEGFPSCLVLDELHFNQVFLNLLSNAVRFTPAGGEISLTMSHAPQADGLIALTAVVRDSGRGMSTDFVSHAYDAFAQEFVDDTGYGAGLGLTIVKSIVDLMGGSIAIESRPGCGTAVTVRLSAAAAQEPAVRPDAGQADEGILRGRRVLLCEDHPMNQVVAQCLLEKAGMQVETAENGQIGVGMFSGKPAGYYDVILMDVRMPVMDGIAAAAAIRALTREDAASIPILALTANAYEEDIERSLAAGMNAHLSKPIDPPTLYSALARYLAAKGKTDQTAAES